MGVAWYVPSEEDAVPRVTAIVAAICALIFVGMSADTAYQRFHHRVPLQGFGDNKHVNRAARIHGNFAEYVPLAIVLLLVLELGETPRPWLMGLGGTLVVARLLHWFGLKTSSGPTPYRTAGVALTWAVLVAEALGLLYFALG